MIEYIEPPISPLEGEQWAVFCRSKDFLISTHGRAYSKIRGRLLSPCVSDLGYIKYYCNEIKTLVTAHRAVALTFIPNPHNKPEVNHKDMDRSNNHISNLEWVTHAENVQHAYDNGRPIKRGAEHHLYGRTAPEEAKRLMSLKKLGANHPKFKGYYVVNGIQYESANQASKYLGISTHTIIRHCKNKLKGCYFIPVNRQ